MGTTHDGAESDQGQRAAADPLTAASTRKDFLKGAAAAGAGAAGMGALGPAAALAHKKPKHKKGGLTGRTWKSSKRPRSPRRWR